VRWLAAVLVWWAPVTALQWLSGAYGAEFGGYPDEAAHYVTALMVRDYLAAGAPAPPTRYAEDYYLHYPKVALGIWGPVPYLLGGLWMWLFSASRVSILLLIALITAVLAATLYRVLREDFALEIAAGATLLFVSMPVVQASTGTVMLDTLVALFSFWAALCFGRFLDQETLRHALLFGVCAALCILTKGNGLALALLPPVALLLSRRFHLLKRWSFWSPLAVMLVTAGPWLYYSARLRTDIHARWVSLEISADCLKALTLDSGVVALVLVMLGFLARVVRPWRTRMVEGRWAAGGALVLAVWGFYSMVPSNGFDPRYAIAGLLPFTMFFAAGTAWLAQRLALPRLSIRVKTALVGLIGLAAFAGQVFYIPKKGHQGFTEAARSLLASAQHRDSVWLVSSEQDGEGLFISEVAMQEKRPGHFILRAGKVLGQSDWLGDRYRVLHPTPEAVMAYLESVPVRAVVLDRRPGFRRREHHHLLEAAIQRFPQRWRLLGRYLGQRAAGGPTPVVETYELLGVASRPRGKIRIDMPYTLGRSLER